MSSQNTSGVKIQLAEKGSGVRPTEDRTFVSDNSVIILDGASQPEPSEFNGAWIADKVGGNFHKRLVAQPDLDLAIGLEASIQEIAERYNLQPGISPSTTIAVARWQNGIMDIFVLCDSPVIVMDRNGSIHEIVDDRLDSVTRSEEEKGFSSSDLASWKQRVKQQRQNRNKPDGYWVVEAVPQAAHHAVQQSFEMDDVAAILLMTDGVSIGIERYGIPRDWNEAFQIALDDPKHLIDMVHEAELSDPLGNKWPRSKCHDDKSLAILSLDPFS